MDSARQIIRWAIPGTFLALIMFSLLQVASFPIRHHDPALFAKISPFTFFQGSIDGTMAAVLTIPVGFLVYQTYYYVYWHFSWPHIIRRPNGFLDYWFRRLFVRSVDKGAGLLKNTTIKVDDNFNLLFLTAESKGHFVLDEKHFDLPSFEKSRAWLGFRTQKRSREVMSRYQRHWEIADAAWLMALGHPQFKDCREVLIKRNEFLSDIYHSLGACRTALILGFIATGLWQLVALFLVTVSLPQLLMFFVLPALFNTWLAVRIMLILQKGAMDSYSSSFVLRRAVILTAFADPGAGVVHPFPVNK